MFGKKKKPWGLTTKPLLPTCHIKSDTHLEHPLHSSLNYLTSASLPLNIMTRQKWTTEEQGDWLKGQLAAFVDSQVNKTTTTTFFPHVIKEWRKQWPLGEPTANEVAGATSLEDTIKKKQTKDDNVRE